MWSLPTLFIFRRFTLLFFLPIKSRISPTQLGCWLPDLHSNRWLRLFSFLGNLNVYGFCFPSYYLLSSSSSSHSMSAKVALLTISYKELPLTLLLLNSFLRCANIWDWTFFGFFYGSFTHFIQIIDHDLSPAVQHYDVNQTDIRRLASAVWLAAIC